MLARSKIIIAFFICIVIFFGSWLIDHTPPSAQAQAVEFMTAPYFGTKPVSVIFDHEYPVYENEDDPPYNGDDQTVVHRDGVRYDLTDCTGYSGHPGIDYPMVYDYVLAAHSGEVVNAGWQQAGNRRYGLGLYVTIQVTNANGIYKSQYGHLSSTFVDAGDEVAQKSVIAISGNTGESTGPHLHFEVQKQHTDFLFYHINPYGWDSANPDPWQEQGRPASVNLWDVPPAITPYSNCPVLMYPSGNPISLSTSPHPSLTPDLTNPTNVLIDNDTRFERFGGPWSFRLCEEPKCYGGSFYYVQAGFLNAFARWQPHRNELVAGEYDVYAYIPGEHAYVDSTLAYYKIYHNRQIHSAGIDQTRFNSPPGYPRTWAYLGRYAFSGSLSTEKVEIYHTYNPDDPGEILAADALVFVLADGPPDVELDIVAGSDDAGPEPGNCTFDTGRPEIYMGYCGDNDDPIISGFRYAAATIPEGAYITRAHLQFQIDGTTSNELHLLFYGDSAANSPTFSESNQPAQRLLTGSHVHWYIPPTDEWPWDIPPEKRYSPDLTPIVQEIIELDGWTSGISAITIIVKPNPSYINESRRVMAYERSPGSGEYDARLFVWYEYIGPPPPTE